MGNRWSEIQFEELDALGAVPVNMVVNDASEGLKRGTLDTISILK